jgi:type II secretion system protein C
MAGFNLPERYVLLLNLLIGVIVIPYFLALSVSDAVKLHLARSILPEASQPAGHGSALTRVVPRSRAAYNTIGQRDIFNLAPPPAAAPVVDESISVKLVGTSELSTGKPYAIIQDSAGKQTLYRVGEMIPGAGQLVDATRDRAVILHNGRRVAIGIPRDQTIPPSRFLPAPGMMQRLRDGRPIRMDPLRPGVKDGVRRLGANRFLLDRSTVNSNIRNMAPLFNEIRATPNVENGAANGFRLSEIQPNSIFQQIGLRDGDLLSAVNGQPIGDPVKAMAMLQSLQSQSSITLNIVRNGAPTQLYYSIR